MGSDFGDNWFSICNALIRNHCINQLKDIHKLVSCITVNSSGLTFIGVEIELTETSINDNPHQILITFIVNKIVIRGWDGHKTSRLPCNYRAE